MSMADKTPKWRDFITENLRTGFVELLILQLLSERDMYGYEIRQELFERSNEVFSMKEGSLYGPLYRMSSNGLISSEKRLVGEKRFRVYYHIESQGKEYLAFGKSEIDRIFNGAKSLLNYEFEKGKNGFDDKK